MPLLSEDRALLDAFRAGRSAALERVYRHYAPRLAHFLRAGFAVMNGGQVVTTLTVRSPFEVENAVQETFSRAFEERTRLAFDGVRRYIDFLCGISKHVVLSDLRKRGRELPVGEVELVAAASAEQRIAQPDVQESLEERQARELVQRFLAEDCDERDRRLYALRYQDDLAQEAAASAAELTRIQVRRWETKFRARLLRYLKRARYVP